MSKQLLLLVSPSPIIAAMLEAAATSLDCQLRRVTSAQDALTYLHNTPAALAIVDQDLPDGDGIALLMQIRDIAPLTERALIVNPSADVHVAIEALNRSRISLILRKPLNDPRVICKGLREALFAYRRNLRDELAALQTQEAAEPQAAHHFTERAQRLERLYTVGEIASGLIHQFNNILTIINGHIELLMGDLDDPKLMARAQTILRAGEDGARLTRSVQDFVRSGKGKTEAFHLNRLIGETLKMTEPIWQSRGSQSGQPIEIATDLQEVSALEGNPGEIREVLTNLVLNAIDAMPNGGRLTVRTAETNHSVFFEVEDSGIGMPESVRQRIFEPFFTTKGEKGNGMGLGIVRRIVREHGGDIRVRTQPGKGTCFTVSLPRAQAAHRLPQQTPDFAIA